MDYIALLLAHFPNLNFVIFDQIHEINDEEKTAAPLQRSCLKQLYKQLARLQKEYKNASKSYSAGKITQHELKYFEQRIIELEEEIKKIEDKLDT
jgi:polyhydroxyalkanoate synthesis regulator phasin